MKSLFLTLAMAPFLILAENNSPTPPPKTCNDSMSMAFEPEKFAGIWFETARNPAPTTPTVCTQVNLTLANNNEAYNVRTTYGDAPRFPWVNATAIASFELGNANNSYGYNFTYALGMRTLPMTTYKLLDTDYTQYALICGYQNIANNASFFNILLTRDRMPSGVQLSDYEKNATEKFVGFDNSSMTKIKQDIFCYTFGSASISTPFIYGVALALLLTLCNMF